MPTIRYASKPLFERPEIISLTEAQANELISAHRGHEFIWSDEVAGVVPEHKEYSPSITEQLVLCSTEFGMSVFTLAAIKKGTILGSYAGELDRASIRHVGDPYLLGVGDPKDGIIINARRKGNWGGIFQHAPEKIASSYAAAGAASPNLNTELVKNCTWFVAARDIEPLEQLTFDYGPAYWNALNIKPVLFNKFGVPLKFDCVFDVTNVFDLVYFLSNIDSDDTRLSELKSTLPHRFEILEKDRVEKGHTMFYYASTIVSMLVGAHQDIWCILRPEDRALLGSVFNRHSFLFNPDDIKAASPVTPFAGELFGRFARFQEIAAHRLFSSTTKVSTLRWSVADELTPTNEARYYLGYKGIPSDKASAESDRFNAAGLALFKEKNYKGARNNFQKALRFARDGITWLRGQEFAALHFSGVKPTTHPYEVYVDECENGHFFDLKVVTCFWNLGNAYLREGNVAEAEFCIKTAVNMVKVSTHAEIIPRLEKYESRLAEIRAAKDTPLHKGPSAGAGSS